MGAALCKSRSSVLCAHPSLLIDARAKYEADFSSYEDDCQGDPEIESYDIAIHGRINRILQTLATGARTRPRPVEALMNAAEFCSEANRDALRVILEHEEDTAKSKEMFRFVSEYVKDSREIIKFHSALENCLAKASNSQRMIKLAVQHFEEEIEKGADANFEKPLEELRRFKEAGDPFTEDFVNLFKSIYKKQESTFKKLAMEKERIDKKLKFLKTWKKVSDVIFIGLFASVLILSVVVVAVVAPPAVIALVAALTVPIGSIGKWASTVWKRFIKEKDEKRKMIGAMSRPSLVLLGGLGSIGAVVCRVEEKILSILGNADLALRDEDGLKVVLGDWRRALEDFSTTIDKLHQLSVSSRESVDSEMNKILKKIAESNTE